MHQTNGRLCPHRLSYFYLLAQFNPNTGKWERSEPPRQYAGISPTVDQGSFGATAIGLTDGEAFPHTSSRPGVWTRFDSQVAGIGCRIAGFTEEIRSKLTKTLTWAFRIVGAIGLLSLVYRGHWITTIALGIIVGPIFYYTSAVVALAISWLIFLPLAILRFIFRNAVTFMLVIAVVAVGWYGKNHVADQNHTYAEVHQQYTEAAGQTYYCDAWVLNIREMPDSEASVIGTVNKGDALNVTDLYADGDFAAVDFGSHRGFVIRRYISPHKPI